VSQILNSALAERLARLAHVVSVKASSRLRPNQASCTGTIRLCEIPSQLSHVYPNSPALDSFWYYNNCTGFHLIFDCTAEINLASTGSGFSSGKLHQSAAIKFTAKPVQHPLAEIEQAAKSGAAVSLYDLWHHGHFTSRCHP
jgi:hypothetical protein